MKQAFYKAAVNRDGQIAPALFQKTAQHLETEVLARMKKNIEKTKDPQMERQYEEAKSLFVKFLKEKKFSLAAELVAKFN